MITSKSAKLLWHMFVLGASTIAAASASDFHHDAAGSLTNIQPSAAVAPSLPNDLLPMQVGFGEALSMTVPVTNAGFATYQWFLNGVAIPGATNANFRLPTTTFADAGRYSVNVSNAFGVSDTLNCQAVSCHPAGGISVEVHPAYEIFTSAAGLVLTGSAVITNGQLRLTRSVGIQTGSAWCASPVSVRDGFTTRFSFRISDPVGGGADGFSFCLQGTGTSLIADENGSGAVIKFDTWQNPGDAGTNFIAVQGTRFGTNAVDLTPFGIVLDNGFPHTAEIAHDGLSVSVWLDGQQVITNAPMPLSGIPSASGELWAGFGSRTGAAWEEHDILSWEFTPRRRYFTDETVEPRARILMNPVSQAVPAGGTAWLAASYLPRHPQTVPRPGVLDGQTLVDAPLGYQWWFNGLALPDQTNATLVISNVRSSEAGEYSVTFFGALVGGISGGFQIVEIGSATNTLAVWSPSGILFNTGVDNNRTPLPDTAVDSHYRLIANPDSSSTNALVEDSTVFPIVAGPWITNTSTSKWIGPRLNTVAAAGGTYVYRTTFELAPVDWMTFRVDGRWASDNAGRGVALNGVLFPQFTNGEFAAYQSFALSTGFVAGVNTIDFAVTNGGSGYTGLRVEMTGFTLVTNTFFTGDSDWDGLQDTLELTNFGNLWQDTTSDFDGDGVSNGDELAEGTDPANPDSLRPRLHVDLSGGYALRTPNQNNFAPGTLVTLTAVPNAGGAFLGWNGDLQGKETTMTFTITSNMVVGGSFGYPFNGTGRLVPGLVEAENFDEGGEGFGYHDANVGNNGAPSGPILRYTDVDLFAAPAASGGYRVGWTATGEWLKYTLDVASNGIYRIELRYSSGDFGGTVHFECAGGNVTIPDLIGQGSYDTYRSVTSAPVLLNTGLQVARLVVERSLGFDLDYFRVLAATSAPPAVAIVHPISGQTFATGVDLALSATASDPDGSVVQVEYFANGLPVATVTNPASARLWRPPGQGVYTLIARAMDNVGLMATSAPVMVTVTTSPLFGGLKAEYFTNIAGGALADLTNYTRFLANTPDLVEATRQFESRTNWADNYGVRLSGWLVPQTTGNYRFYLASDDQGVLFLSTDESPANKRTIASEPVWNGYREFITGGNQGSRRTPATNISGNIALVAGKAYYVEGLLKEATSGDHLAVAWLPPVGAAVTNGAAPIPGSALVYGTPSVGNFAPLGAAALTNSGQIGVGFGRLLDQSTATVTTSYQVSGAAVTGAVLSPDRHGVLLSVSGLSGAGFTVRVGAVKDIFGNSTPLSTELIGAVLPQMRQDVGAVGDPVVAGTTFSSRAGEFDVVAGGSDIWDNADHFHFVYEQRAGDFDVQVRVESLEAVNRWAKAGLMVRETLTSGSRHLLAEVTPAGPTRDGAAGGQGLNAYELLVRTVAGQATASWATNSSVANVPYPNAWIRLKREGNTFSAYRSSDGLAWTPLGQTNQTYPTTIYLGLATTSHSNASGYAALARYRNYGLAGLSAPSIVQQPVSVGVGAGALATFSVQANGSAPLNYQWRFHGTNLVNATNATLTINPALGIHAGSYQAVVWNNAGLVLSAAATLTVSNNLPPVSSGFGATTPQNQPLTLTVAALLGPITDPEGGLVTLVSVNATSTNGAIIVLNGPNVTYTPLSGFVGADRFDYVVSDPLGAQSSVPAQIAVLLPGAVANAAQLVVAAPGSVSFGFTGLPGRTYTVQRAESPAGPWIEVGTLILQPDGSGQYADPAPPAGSGFYRTLLRP